MTKIIEMPQPEESEPITTEQILSALSNHPIKVPEDGKVEWKDWYPLFSIDLSADSFELELPHKDAMHSLVVSVMRSKEIREAKPEDVSVIADSPDSFSLLIGKKTWRWEKSGKNIRISKR